MVKTDTTVTIFYQENVTGACQKCRLHRGTGERNVTGTQALKTALSGLHSGSEIEDLGGLSQISEPL